MQEHVCPWWLAYTFDNPLRRLVHSPEKLLGPYVKDGMRVMDLGCGLGHFSLGMARMVGPGGAVLSVDVQERMLATLRRRSLKAGIEDRIITHLCKPDKLGVVEQVDFILAFWMIHETPEPGILLTKLGHLLKPEGRLLVAEPMMHVKAADFEDTIKLAETRGLRLLERPEISFSRAALLAHTKPIQ